MPTKKTPTRKTVDQIRTENNTTDPKQAAELAADRETARKKLDGISSPDFLLVSLTNTGIEISRQLSQVGEKLKASMDALNATNLLVTEAEERLQRTHDLDALQTSIDEMIAEYDRKKAELDSRIEAETKAYDLSVADRAARWTAEDAERRTARKREDDTYTYNLQMQRQKDEDAYQRGLVERMRSEEVARARRISELEAREAVIRGAEKELADLRAQVAAMPDQLKKEKDAAIAIACNSLKKDLAHEAALNEARLKAEIASLQLKISMMDQQLKVEMGDKAALKAEAQQLREQVQTIATKALDSASGVRALDEVRSLIRDQSTTAASATKTR